MTREETERNSLINAILKTSVTHGEFILRSGAKSSYYMDIKKLAMSRGGQYFLGRAICCHLKEFMPTVVTGLESGAIPLVCAAVNGHQQLFPYELHGSFVRKEKRTHGTQKPVAGYDIGPVDRVAVLEDVVTKGDSLIDAIKKVQELNPTAIYALCVVDKLQGGAEKILSECGITLRSLLTVKDLGLE